jgi:mRNA interferase MazF
MAAKKPSVNFPKRGEVYLVNFDPTVGAEIQKTRPALILQNDIANQYSPITMVAALTSQFAQQLYPTEVGVHPPEGGLTVESVVLLNQVRSIDKSRLVKRLGSLKPATLCQVEQALLISFGIIKV